MDNDNNFQEGQGVAGNGQYQNPNMSGYGNDQYQDPNMGGYGNGQYQNPNMSGYGNGQYQDPNMGGFGNAQYQNPNMAGYGEQYQNPTVNSFGDAVPAKTVKKKKGLKIAIISIAVVVVAAIAVVVAYLFLKKTPEEVVKSAVKKTAEEAAENGVSYEKVLGLSSFEENGTQVDADITVNSIYELDSFNGANLSFSTASEKREDGSYDANMSTALTIAGESLKANLYANEEAFYMELPEISESLFKVDLGALMNKLEESASSNMTSVDEERIKELAEEYLEPAVKDLKDSVAYDKVGKETITVHNGNSVKCKHYTVTVPTEKVKGVVTAFGNYINAYSDEFFTEEMLSEMEVTREQLKQIFDMLPQYYGYVFTRDFVCDVYVKDGQTVRYEFNYTFSMLGADVKCVIDMMGDKAAASDIYAEISAVSGDNKVVFIADYSQDKADSKVTEQGTASVLLNDKTLGGLEFNTTFDEKSYDISSGFSLTVEEKKVFACEAVGKFKNVDKGKSIELAIDSMKVTDGNGVVYVDLAFNEKISKVAGDIKKPDTSKNVVNIEDITDEEMENLLDMEELERIISAWSETIPKGSSNGELDLGDFEGLAQESEKPSEEEAPLTEEEITEASTENGDGNTTEDFSDVKLEDGGYTVVINDPAGFARSYASVYEIDMYDNEYSVYYSIKLDTDIEKKCEEFLSYYDYFDKESCEVKSSEMKSVVLEDGQTIDCYVIQAELYSSNVIDLYYFYPLNEKDYILINVEKWSEDIDIDDAAKKFVNTDIIKIQ